MNQLTLTLTAAPIAHRSDPWTSHAAALDVTASGKRSTDAERVLSGVSQYPGRTSTELADLLGMPLYAVRRRLSDLGGEYICKGEAVARGGQRSQVTWYATGGIA